MFKQVPHNREQRLKKKGSLYLKVLPTQDMFRYSNHPTIINAVMYKRSSISEHSFSIFMCDITKFKHMIIYDNLRLHDNIEKMDEGTIYFLLGWFIEKIEEFGRETNIKTVILESRLPHIADWLVEHRWTLNVSSSHSDGFRGTKQLEETIHERNTNLVA